jgi:hypothetical protein
LLTPGHKLGPHEIDSPLGARGMREVYRALDTRLGREARLLAALKIAASEASIPKQDKVSLFLHFNSELRHTAPMKK